MGNSEVLTWTMRLEADVDGAAKFDKALHGAQAGLGATEEALKRTGKSTNQAGDELKRLRDHLQELRRPGEISKVREEIERFGKPAKDAAEGFKGIGHAIEESKNQVHDFLGAIGAFAAFEVISKGVEIFKEFGVEAIKGAAAAERMDEVYKNIFGEKKGAETLEYAHQFAKKNDISDQEAIAAVANLGRSGVAPNRIGSYMNAAADVKATGGDFSEAIQGIDRAHLFGKIGARELIRLGIGIPQLQQLKEFEGKSAPQMRQFIQTGELTEPQMLRAIAGKNNVLGDKAFEMGTKTSASISHLGDVKEHSLEAFSKRPGFHRVKSEIDNITKKVDPEDVADILDATADAAVAVAHPVQTAKKAASGLTDVIAGHPENSKAGRFFHLLFSPTEGVVTREEREEDERDLDALDSDQKGGVKDTGAHTVAGVVEGASGAKSGMAKRGDEAVDGFVDTIYRRGIPEGHAAGAAMAGAAVDGGKHGIDAHSPSRKFARVGGDAVLGLTGALSEGEEAAWRAGISLADASVRGARSVKAHGKSPIDVVDFSSDNPDDASDEIPAMEMPARKRRGGNTVALDRSDNDTGAEDLSQLEHEHLTDEVALFEAIVERGHSSGRLAGPDPFATGLPLGSMDKYSTKQGEAADTEARFPADASSESSGARKVEINIPITISVGEGARSRDVDEVIARLKSDLPGALGPALEQLAIEAGV